MCIFCKQLALIANCSVARGLLLTLGFGTQSSVGTDGTPRIRFFPPFYTEVPMKTQASFCSDNFSSIDFRRLTYYFIRIVYLIQLVRVRRADYPLEQRLIRILLFPYYIVFFPPFLADLINHQYVYGKSLCQ